jgi:transcriptional regulator with XRE-family HTH domain
MKNTLDPVAVRFGLNLRRLRSVAGLSQTELGRRLGITFQQVQKYENGSNNANVPTLHHLKHIFGCELNDFFVEDAGPGMAADAASERQQRVVCRLSRAALGIEAPDVQDRLILLARAMATKL